MAALPAGCNHLISLLPKIANQHPIQDMYIREVVKKEGSSE